MFKQVWVHLINVYQRHIGIILPSSCCFYPSCSEYAKEAIIKYGFLKGLGKAIKRLLRCHPFSGKAGYDPLI